MCAQQIRHTECTVCVRCFNWSFVFRCSWFIQLNRQHQSDRITANDIHKHKSKSHLTCIWVSRLPHNIIHSIQIKMKTVFLFHKRSKNRNVIDTKRQSKATPNGNEPAEFHFVSIERPMLATLSKPRICKPLRARVWDLIKASTKRKYFKVQKAFHRIVHEQTTSESAGQLNGFRCLEQQQILWVQFAGLIC